MKIVKIIQAFLSIIGGLTVIAAVFFALMDFTFPWFSPEKEIFRLPSPDTDYDAVVTAEVPGGFGSSHLKLYIVAHGIPFEKKRSDFKFYNFHSHRIVVDGLEWLSPRTLRIIRPQKDSIYSFNPSWKNEVKILLETKDCDEIRQRPGRKAKEE
ncbi:MAG: hypothetical protein A2010_18045 [Nitrospirae bacterium GWD2_57_9]|nr:MAG: hypothetical protein A2010_18045 [Nitrospirae bacterium GWD2_57_9]OGW50740.1 MAG: hypothetical protein A2078_00500 [Nitrospirae bacterium GWC2_57_9]